MTHEEIIQKIFARVGELFCLEGFSFKLLNRQVDENGRGVIDLKKSYTLAYTNLRTKDITIDIYTTKNRKPKAIASILRILAHEIAHHQRLPFRQFHRGKWIVRQHYPEFYRQVNSNVEKMKRDQILGQFFVEKITKRKMVKKVYKSKGKNWFDRIVEMTGF